MSPSSYPVRRAALTTAAGVGLFAAGVVAGVRWGDRLTLAASKPPPAAAANPTPAAPPPTGEALLANLDARLAEVGGQVDDCVRGEQEATVARNLLRNQGVPPDAEACREQEQLRTRAAARKAELAAERAELARLRGELLAAMSAEKPEPAATPGETDLATRVRTFVIRQDLLRGEPAPKPPPPAGP